MVLVCVDEECGYMEKKKDVPLEKQECPHCFNIVLVYTDKYWEDNVRRANKNLIPRTTSSL